MQLGCEVNAEEHLVVQRKCNIEFINLIDMLQLVMQLYNTNSRLIIYQVMQAIKFNSIYSSLQQYIFQS